MRPKKAIESECECAPQKVQILGDFRLRTAGAGGFYFGGYLFMLGHFAAINSNCVDAKGIFGTGTTTVLSWMIGFLFFFVKDVVLPARRKVAKGGEGAQISYKISRALRYELILLLGQLFVLAVGAGAFSRGYYGWLNGHDSDIFQSLSLKYLERNADSLSSLPPELIEWFKVSVTSRFTGLGWWVCEIIDPVCHQLPFLAMAYLSYTHEALQNLTDDITLPLVGIVSIVGPAQRFFWDLSTCGTMVCDGPYHGFLKHVKPLEQMFWHTAPGLLFCVFLYVLYSMKAAESKQPSPPFTAAAKEIQGIYSFTKTLVIIVAWGFFQCFLAWRNGGELGFRL